MSDPSEPEGDDTQTPPTPEPTDAGAEEQSAGAEERDDAEAVDGDPEQRTETLGTGSETETETLSTAPEAETEAFNSGGGDASAEQTPERRFTAPGFDAGSTEIIESFPEPETEQFLTPHRAQQSKRAAPQLIPPRLASRLPSAAGKTWGWVLALLLVVLAVAAIAVLGTTWLTRSHPPKVSQEDQVRATIEEFDTAVQNGDLTTLRTITCGGTRDDYLNYDDRSWADTYERVAAAKRYPVVASIDEVIVNGDHAEANVTAFVAHAPEARSTRSFDLQFRDDQWKICQAPTG